MRVVTVARKPLSEPSLLANVLEHGTGTLNVDGTRVGTGKTDTTEGRWPTNLVLQHFVGCRWAGTKRVRGAKPAGSGQNLKHDRVWCDGGGWRQRKPFTYREADGRETADAWNCAPGCPVAGLDFQSAGAEVDTLHNDSGGVSRFFKQVGGQAG